MTILKFKNSIICLSFALLACLGSASAQPSSVAATSAVIETAPVNTIYFRSVAVNHSQNLDEPIDVLVFGSIRGRVFNDADLRGTSQTANPQGIAGVKVILRSADAGFARFVADKISDATGAYDFRNLRPGNYTIDLDPVSIPAKFRIPVVRDSGINVLASRWSYVDIPIAAQRSITGIVFIDKDGDGRYKAGNDEPVEGAYMTINGNLAVSDMKGWYILRDLPAGRIGLLVSRANKDENTHVVFDLEAGPVTKRIVNVPINP